MDPRLKSFSYLDVGLGRCVSSGKMPRFLVNQILIITPWSLPAKPSLSVSPGGGEESASVDGALDTG